MHQARFENLREDFVAFLDRHQIASTALREAILTSPPSNPSEGREHYRAYYDDETRELVGTSLIGGGAGDPSLRFQDHEGSPRPAESPVDAARRRA